MARIIRTITVECPWCGAIADVRVWSCGCQSASGEHKTGECEGRHAKYFEKFEHNCWDFKDEPDRIPSFLKEKPSEHKP